MKFKTFYYLSILSFVAFTCLAVPAIAQTRTVSGLVSDESGIPLAGVNVSVEGTASRTTTNDLGAFSIAVIGDEAVLAFTYVGYEPLRSKIGTTTQLTIQLIAIEEALEEVVVVGYGTQRKRDLTGAISQVKGEVIQNQPHANLSSLLNGRLSGIQVTTNSGTPGGGVTMRIRGNTSLNSGNDPLYVVDGVPTGDITAFNPNDIESIEVLKDASASAIYGARAANGVVLITTKRGKAGATSYQVNAYTGLQQVSRKIPMMNAQEQYEYVVKGTENYNRVNPATPMEIRPTTLADYEAGYDTDWQDEIFRTAPIQNYDFAFNGGSERSRYAGALNYFDQDGVIISSGYKRINGRFNVDADLNSWLKFGTNMMVSRELRDRVPENDSPESVLGNTMRKLPYEPVYESDGSYSVRERPNPVAQALETYDFGYSTKILGSAFVEVEPFKDLKIKSFLALDYRSYRDEFFKPSFILGGTNRPARASGGENNSWLNENTVSYRLSTNEDHELTVLAGISFQESKSYAHRARGSLGATDAIPTLNASAQRDEVFSNQTSWGISSFFGRVNYALLDRYLLTFNLRRDGSSRFGKSNQYATFPAASVGWRISEEKFFDFPSVVNELKIRASYGKTGNQSIGNFVAQGVYNTGADYAGDPGVRIGGIPVNNLTWESTDQLDIGLDGSLLHNRLSLSADYYVKKTNGLLFNVPLPTTTGFGSTLQNLGGVENRGVELTLTGHIIDKENFTWSSDFNISFNRNKVQSLPGGTPLINSYTTDTYYSINGSYITMEQEAIGMFYGYKWTGEIYPTDEAAKAHVSTILGREPIAGTIKYEDFNGDGKIDANDRQLLGSPHPDFAGGFNNVFRYKQLDLAVLCQFVSGNVIYNQNRTGSDRGFIYNAATKDMLNAWGAPGQNTDRHKAFATSDQMDNQFSSMWLEDGSYLRLKNVTLGYNFTQQLTAKLGMSSARIYLVGQNLFTATKYKGFDPEVNTKTGDVRTLGVDLGAFPQVRTIMIGLNIGF